MAMEEGYLNAIATEGGSLITHIGLIDDEATELTGGTPAYARIAVTWTEASGGVIRPNADLTFNVPASGVVAGWRGYSASTGGTNYGGAALTEETFAVQGTYKLLAASSGITHSST